MSENPAENAWTHKDAIRFLVSFGQADLATYREGDLLNLRDDLERFRKAPVSDAYPFPVSRTGAYPTPLTWYTDLQSWIRKLLTWITQSPDGDLDPELERGVALKVPVILQVVVVPSKGPIVGFGGDLAFCLRVKATLMLAGESSQLVRRCPECPTIFVRVRKQLYCSRKCTNAANMRAWLLTKQNKAKHRESSQRTYEKAVKRKCGPKVKVQRRPRQK